MAIKHDELKSTIDVATISTKFSESSTYGVKYSDEQFCRLTGISRQESGKRNNIVWKVK